MKRSLLQLIARTRSVSRALDTLSAVEGHLLLILPSTRRALSFAHELCNLRPCCVLEGSITGDSSWQFTPFLRNAADIAQAYAGQPELPCTVISFPDQLIGEGPSFSWLPFNGRLHSFCLIEALLVLRHRPPVYTLRTLSSEGDFLLSEIPYQDLLAAGQEAFSMQRLLARLLGPLECELASPPPDWLASALLAAKSETQWRSRLREELKELECLLRLHLLSPTCDPLRVATALAAMVARQKHLFGLASH